MAKQSESRVATGGKREKAIQGHLPRGQIFDIKMTIYGLQAVDYGIFVVRKREARFHRDFLTAARCFSGIGASF